MLRPSQFLSANLTRRVWHVPRRPQFLRHERGWAAAGLVTLSRSLFVILNEVKDLPWPLRVDSAKNRGGPDAERRS